MGILNSCKWLLLLAVVCAGARTWASGEDLPPDPHDLAVEAQTRSLCSSTDEYIKTLKFLRSNKELEFPESTSRMIAEKVSRGCDGASERFSQVLMLLKTVGLSDRKSLEMALEFSSQPPDVQKNFTEIFTRSFLGEFFDYDYATAARLAYELSKDYKGEPAQVRDDFIELVRYCKDGKTLDLPTKLCAELTIKLARLSQYYPDGVRKPFYKLFRDLRERKDFLLDMKTALEVSYNVLKSGPKAPENFFSAYKYAGAKEGLDLDRRKALAFALKMADRSFIGGSTPPAIPAVWREPAGGVMSAQTP
jgi:hypothetical protein